ncbi:Hypothetical predicted protein [Octopus vulgaris]|uniref:Uncharacterized protein n=2 Tax=Octopus TaxID=6643 RepID=A0AA36B1U0_OCTVU|nr:uncharacterized protein LOC115213832 [Octopus sinensis]XP_036360985.1 uncharacterized protein LOC115213832 [Octopus sinensis]CAI9726400.1 Hypothetical predicted protein [Octopus vulgaris]
MKDIFLMTLLLWLCVVPEAFCSTSKSSALKIRIREPLGIKTMKRTAPFRQQSTGPPTGWWLYANGFDNRGKKLEKKFLGRNESAFSSGTITARALLEDFIENLKLKNNGKLEVCLNR